MTIAQQRQAVNDQFDVQADLVGGENVTLTPANQTASTDAQAIVLGSLNPVHDYPPKLK